MADTPEHPVVCILGPTASGKTAVASALTQLIDCDLISVDSSQVYRRMNIGSAKPGDAELLEFPHQLIDIREPWETYSAADFLEDASLLVRRSHAAGRVPVLVGGTMLYFRAFTEGLATMPPANAEVRQEIEAMAQAEGWSAVHRRLAAVDPNSAARIHPNDPQRIQRALEVYKLTGQTIHAIQQSQTTGGYAGRLLKFGLFPEDRRQLHRQINQRFDDMLEQGLVDEVKALQSEPAIDSSLPSQRAVGYRQVWQYLEAAIDYERLVESGKTATRQLAKRQMTWMRGMQSLQVFDSFNGPALQLAETIAAAVTEPLGPTGPKHSAD